MRIENVSECGGMIFNRHSWRNYGIGRLCQKCGHCEMFMEGPDGGYWYTVTYDEMVKGVKEYKAREEKEMRSKIESKRKALQTPIGGDL